MPGTAAPVPLAGVTRGPLVESVHLGHVAAVTGDGRLVLALGDPEAVVYLRSSAKPFQALPTLLDGAAKRFGYTDEEVALACGSHEGEPVHQEVARRMLEKAGLGPEALRCGAIPPLDEATAEALLARGEAPSPLHNECSGEHASMAALAQHLGAAFDTYTAEDYPVQRRVREEVARFAGVEAGALTTATDGCRIPTFAVSLRAAALMYARLAAPPAEWDAATEVACARVFRSMVRHPEMVEGTRAEALSDTALLRVGGGRLVSKLGAEGLFTAAVKPSEAWPVGLGVAVKVADGDADERARPPIAVALLYHLGVLTGDDLARLAAHGTRPVTDNEGDVVGEVRAVWLGHVAPAG